MRRILLWFILLCSIKSFGQGGAIKASPAYVPASVQTFIDSILKKQDLLNNMNFKTINGTQLWGGGGNIVVTTSLPPDADFYATQYGGSNVNSGASKLYPKLTLRSIDTLINNSVNSTVTAAFEGGSIFNSEGISLNRGQVSLKSYNMNKPRKYNLPLFKGTGTYNTGWVLTGGHTYQQSITNSILLSIGDYANMPVIEIDTLLEKTDPLTARKYLRRAVSLASVDTVAGSWWCPITSGSPVTISIHTSDGISPNSHPKYRYEVVRLNGVVNRNLSGTDGGSLSVSGLFGMDWGQGTGPFASRQDSFSMDHCVVMGNTIHQLVCGNYSTVDKSAFIQGDPNIDGGAIIFYQIDGANETNTVSNCYFLDNPSILYSHTSFGVGGSVNHGRLNLFNSYAWNAGSIVQTPLTVDTLDINYVYAKNSNSLISASESKIAYVKNTVLDNVGAIFSNCKNCVVTNTFYKSKKTPGQAIIASTNNRLRLTNSTLHVKNTSSLGSDAGTFLNNSDTSSRVVVKNNIFIGEALPDAFVTFASANDHGGAGTSKDTFNFNAYIIVQGTPRWKLANGGSVTSFSAWKTGTGQDANSIYIDLRTTGNADLKRIFIDPDNGNYNLTSSVQADSIRAIIAGMKSPVINFVGKPTREQVVDFIENDYFQPVGRLMGKLD